MTNMAIGGMIGSWMSVVLLGVDVNYASGVTAMGIVMLVTRAFERSA